MNKDTVVRFRKKDEVVDPLVEPVFCVFATVHPGVALAPINMSAAVSQMVRRALDGAADAAKGPGGDGS